MLSLLHLEGGFLTLMDYQLSWFCWLTPQFPSLPSLSISTYFDRTNRTYLFLLYPVVYTLYGYYEKETIEFEN